MNIANKLPTINNAELASLNGNTQRLIHAGTPAQRAAAAALMPSIAAELAARSDAAAARRAAAGAVRRAGKMKPGTAVAG